MQRAKAAPESKVRSPRSSRLPQENDASTAPYHHGNLREELVRVGKARLLGPAGSRELTLRQIAADAGVSQVAPLHHFGNKEGLLAAIATSGFDDLTRFRLARLKSSMNPEVRFRTILAAYVQFALANPALFHLMFAPDFKNPSLHAELNDAASQSFDMVAQAAAAFLGGGDERRSSAADEAARIAWMCLHGVAILLVENRFNPLGAAKTKREQLVQRVIDVVFAGLRS